LCGGVLGGASGVVGTALSATIPAPACGLTRGWPTGPLITLVAAGFFVVSMLLAPRRGVVAEVVRRAGLRRRVQSQHVLRAAYEQLEGTGDLGGAWSADELGALGSALGRLARGGLVEGVGVGAYRLTARGQEEARRVVRTHRLWELFLIRHADIAPDHVDRDADMIEHVLPAETVAKLEEELAAMGRAPLPESPHPVTPTAKRGRA
jgi:manganese/zinc/iron transport system permease protein